MTPCTAYVVGTDVQCERCGDWCAVVVDGMPPLCPRCVERAFNVSTTVCPHCGRITPDGSHCQKCHKGMYQGVAHDG